MKLLVNAWTENNYFLTSQFGLCLALSELNQCSGNNLNHYAYLEKRESEK